MTPALIVGTVRRMAADDAACAQHVWVLAVVGEGRGRLDIASTCSLCGALNDEHRTQRRWERASRLVIRRTDGVRGGT